MSNSSSKSEIVRSTILALLTPRLSRPQFDRGIDATTELLEVGLIDSKDLLDIILAVEQLCSVEFSPERIDLEGALTLDGLVGAFAPS